jgi:hypothetical protein
MAQVESDGGSGGRSAGHQLASSFQRAHALVPGGSADVLDYDVDAFFVGDLADFFGNLLLIVVDAVVGAKRAAFLEFGFVAGGGDYAAVKQLGDLDGGYSHARAGAQHEHGLAGTHGREPHQHVPRGHEHERDASGLIEVERVGNRNDVRGRDGDRLAIAAVDGIARGR